MLYFKVEKAKRSCTCSGLGDVRPHEIKKGEWRLSVSAFYSQGYLCKKCLELALERMKEMNFVDEVSKL